MRIHYSTLLLSPSVSCLIPLKRPLISYPVLSDVCPKVWRSGYKINLGAIHLFPVPRLSLVLFVGPAYVQDRNIIMQLVLMTNKLSFHFYSATVFLLFGSY